MHRTRGTDTLALTPRLRRVIFGCSSPKDGAAGSVLNLLQQFFRERRGEKTPELEF